MRQNCGWTFYNLNIDLIKKSLLKFKGKHDFNAFRSSECQAKSSVRTISKICVKQHKEYFLFTFVADAFLQHQIRNMLGTILKVGYGAIDVSRIDFLLKQNELAKTFPDFQVIRDEVELLTDGRPVNSFIAQKIIK